MTDPTKQLAAWNQAAYDTALAYARASLESAEQLLRLNLETARATLEANGRATQELLSAHSPDTLLASRAKAAETAMQQAAAYAQTVYEIVSDTQGQLARLFEQQVAQLNKAISASAEELARSAPGGEVSTAAIKSTMAATNAMLESLTQASRQFAGLAETTMKAATAQMVNDRSKKD